MKALEMGSVETLICWENLDIQRVTLKNHASGEEKILFLNSEQEKDKTLYTDQETGVEMELEEVGVPGVETSFTSLFPTLFMS